MRRSECGMRNGGAEAGLQKGAGSAMICQADGVPRDWHAAVDESRRTERSLQMNDEVAPEGLAELIARFQALDAEFTSLSVAEPERWLTVLRGLQAQVNAALDRTLTPPRLSRS